MLYLAVNFTQDWNILLWHPSLICPFSWYDCVGDAAREYSGTASAKQHNSTSITSDELTSRGIGHSEDPPADTSGVTDLKPTPNINHAHGGMDSLISSTVSQ